LVRSPKIVIYVLGCGLAMICEQPCAAQTAPGEHGLETIVVTAQRRAERPEDVPIFLTVRSGEQLKQMQATDMAGLGKVVPSLNMMRTGAFTQPYLRGVGKRSTLGVENNVATYVDGVYIASAIGALLDLRGIARVEVLNGPQGTLFGRNTTGGVIQVVTRDPGAATVVEAELHAGTYEHMRADAYVSGGNDRIAGNLAMSLSRNGGYGTNFFSGKDELGKVGHSFVARSKWIWRPSAALKLTIAGDYQDSDHDFSYRTVAGYPSIGMPRVQDFHDGDQDTFNRHRFRYGGTSLKAEADLGPVTVMSLSAWRRMRARSDVDSDRGPLPLLSASPVDEQDQLSQEFQLQSAESSRFKWVAGLYYVRIEERYDPTNFLYGGAYSERLGGRLSQTLFSSGSATSYAAFAQGTMPIGQSTNLTLGLRYTIEQRSVRAMGEQTYDNPPFIRPIPGLPLLTEEPLRDSKSFDELTWRASLDRQFSDAVMGYVSVSRGFQSGGWNLQTPQVPAFDPERLDDFEAGLKYLDSSRRFSADASVFYYDYSDIQVSAITPTGAATANAASGQVYGLGLQLDARLKAGTDFTIGLQWLKTRYTSFSNASCTNYAPNPANPLAPMVCDATGNRFPYAPKLKFNAGANHQLSLGRIGTLLLSANLAYNSGFSAEPDNVVKQKVYATVDASAEWRPTRPGPSVKLWVLNLTDAEYVTSLATMPTVGVFQSPAAPRRFGATLAFTY
jgi:iron complex outermembrane receptor protein